MDKIWKWLKSLFMTRYKVVVSFDSEYGNNDDKIYMLFQLIGVSFSIFFEAFLPTTISKYFGSNPPPGPLISIILLLIT